MSGDDTLAFGQNSMVELATNHRVFPNRVSPSDIPNRPTSFLVNSELHQHVTIISDFSEVGDGKGGRGQSRASKSGRPSKSERPVKG